MVCKECQNRVVMHGFSNGNCSICNKSISSSHTPCDKVCLSCAQENNVCIACGKPLDKHKEAK